MKTYLEATGPTKDRLGPDGKTGHYYAWHGFGIDDTGKIIKSVCLRGSEAEEVMVKWAKFLQESGILI